MNANKQWREAVKAAIEMLEVHQKEWKSLADSGDAGFWKAEETRLWKDTEAVMKQLQALDQK